ncbi:MAG: ATP-dependent RNA helicase RhlB [Kiritimatiellaceae bacterium]|nr:MAG: ATP-dependent RNA helicase RhlB [Kiritimatiellaceae bacterium]
MKILKKIASALGGGKQSEEASKAPAKRSRPDRKRQASATGSKEEWRPGQSGGVPAKKRTERSDKDRKPRREREDQPPHNRKPRSDEKLSEDRSAGRPQGDRKRPPRKPREERPAGDRPPRAKRPPVDDSPWDVAEFKVEPEEGKVRFHDLELHPKLMRSIHALGWEYATPIQGEILPGTLKGKDMAGRAQTGTGKTAAFLISIINHCLKNPLQKHSMSCPRALIIAPTRELAIQIGKDSDGLNKFTGLRTVVLFGGMDFTKQQRQLDEGLVDIIVATPGRLLDFENRKVVNLRFTEIMVIDEADRMLDMGFIPDVRRIIFKTPPKEKRQTVLFSATLTDDVMRLAAAWMIDPERIDVEPEQVATDTVDQKVFIVTDDQKFQLLYNIIKTDEPERIIIFTNRRDQAERLSDDLARYGHRNEMLSGAVNQNRRTRILEEFRAGKVRVLVATDVAGRGIHVDGVSHVVNFNIPENPDDYVHRIGRTGRAGATGQSITFACEMESFELPKIEELIGMELKCKMPPEELFAELPDAPPRKPRPRSSGGRSGGGNRSGGNRSGGRSGGGQRGRSGPPRR